MEFHHHHHHGHGFLEDMLDSNIAFGINDNNYIDDPFDQNALLATPTTFLESSPLSITSQTSSSFEDFSLPFTFNSQTLNCSSFGQHFTNPFVDHELLSAATLNHTPPNIKLESSPFNDQDYYSMLSMLDDVKNCHFVHDVSNYRVNPEMPYPQGVMGDPEPERPTGFNMGKNGKNCKVEGQPSKNLMAERRRRKRLNERLSMLRSIVPKISKMDRTSILADTIDYMKELIEKIKHMQQQMDMVNMNDLQLSTQPKDIFIRNSPKFDVERRNTDTCVQVCCSGKPELLISTMSTLEALGLHIHECVVSCFNDFTMHASCQEDMEQRLILKPDDIKQALFRNAGYGGRCL
ncbi:transcription factor bHLH61-like [Bidens hawaiensis]|uniref:transcription factor bHLH61-like n=1 Tax=Bidens hawaiensis TaxID=980011 RepID=UPI00404B9D7C